MPGYIKGILLGLANTFVVAVAIAFGIEDSNPLEAMLVICFMGVVPSLVIGGLLGHYGETMQTTNRRVVVVGMCAIACGAVAVLGLMFALSELVLASCIPTIAACALLERWTRAEPASALPLARVA